MDKRLYIIVSQPGTAVARMLRWFTKAEYNHVSLSLSEDLQFMYSFGRRHRYHPFWGGFIQESPNAGVFGRYPNTRVAVLSVAISHETHEKIAQHMAAMLAAGRKYRYNYLGVFFAAFHIRRSKGNCYYCSEFVKEMLLQYQIHGSESLCPVVQPIHFLDLPYSLVYQGKLADYVASR